MITKKVFTQSSYYLIPCSFLSSTNQLIDFYGATIIMAMASAVVTQNQVRIRGQSEAKKDYAVPLSKVI